MPAPIVRTRRALFGVAVRVFGLYLLLSIVSSIPSLVWVVAMQTATWNMDMAAGLLPLGLQTGLGLVCLLAADRLATLFFGRREAGTEADDGHVSIEGVGVLRAGLAILGLYLLTETFEPIQAVAVELLRSDDFAGAAGRWREERHERLMAALIYVGLHFVAAGCLLFGTRRLVTRIATMWRDEPASVAGTEGGP